MIYICMAAMATQMYVVRAVQFFGIENLSTRFYLDVYCMQSHCTTPVTHSLL